MFIRNEDLEDHKIVVTILGIPGRDDGVMEGGNIFDLISDREQDDRIEYRMRNISFIPRRGEIIDIDNGCLNGQLKYMM